MAHNLIDQWSSPVMDQWTCYKDLLCLITADDQSVVLSPSGHFLFDPPIAHLVSRMEEFALSVSATGAAGDIIRMLEWMVMHSIAELSNSAFIKVIDNHAPPALARNSSILGEHARHLVARLHLCARIASGLFREKVLKSRAAVDRIVQFFNLSLKSAHKAKSLYSEAEIGALYNPVMAGKVIDFYFMGFIALDDYVNRVSFVIARVNQVYSDI